MRILILTQWFDPEPTFKGLAFAKELVRVGHEVQVLTGFPNYPGGRVYTGYRQSWCKRELIDGVYVIRVPLYPSHDQNALGRVANYLSFALSALWHGIFSVRQPHVIYAYHPPLTVGVVAALLRFLRRVPVVYDIQDLWPDTLAATGMFSSQRALKLVDLVCRVIYRQADHLAVLSPGFQRALVQRGVPESKISVIYNWCDEFALSTRSVALPPGFPVDASFKLVFAGNMGKAQALGAVLRAAQIVFSANPAVRFVFIGGGVELSSLKNEAVKLDLKNVVFMPAVPMSQVGVVLTAADALLIHLREDPLFEITIPSKVQAYMFAGRPALAAVRGDAAELILKSGCGVIAKPEDAQSIAAAILSMAGVGRARLDQMGAHGRDYYDRNLSLRAGVAAFCVIFERVAQKTARQ